MKRRISGTIVIVVTAGVLGAGCGGSEEPADTAPSAVGSSLPEVSCDSALGGARYSGTDEGARIVLGTLAVPSAHLPEGAVPSGKTSRPYAATIDLVLRSEQPPLEITVPKAWRKRVAISAGGTKIVHTLRFPTCPNLGLPWNAFEGRIYVIARHSCVPLLFRSGSRRQELRFGLGQRCD